MFVSRRTFSRTAKDVLDPTTPSGATERAPDLLLRENGVERTLDRLSVSLGPKHAPRPLDLPLETPVPRGHAPGYRRPSDRGKAWSHTRASLPMVGCSSEESARASPTSQRTTVVDAEAAAPSGR